MTEEDNKPTLTITEKAIEAIKKSMLEAGADTTPLRVSVAGGGCSGYQYQLDFDTEGERMGDEVLVFGELRVLIDPLSAGFLKGTTIDYKSGLNETGFVFNNPNSKRTCGCGSSFS